MPAGTATGELSSYLYVKLAQPVTLAAGTYTIGAYESQSADLVQFQVPSITPAGGITYGAARLGGDNAFPATNILNESNGYFGPNFQFVVPEPSTWALLGIGPVSAGLVALRRRRVVP